MRCAVAISDSVGERGSAVQSKIPIVLMGAVTVPRTRNSFVFIDLQARF
jgi:hypothetical protein